MLKKKTLGSILCGFGLILSLGTFTAFAERYESFNLALYGRTYIKSITFPEVIQDIDGTSVSSCANLQKVSFPKSLSSIDYGAFGDCKNLYELEFNGSDFFIDTSAFFSNSVGKITVPCGFNTSIFNDSALNASISFKHDAPIYDEKSNSIICSKCGTKISVSNNHSCL